MKRVLVLLLVLWTCINANLAQAHSTQEAAHLITHAMDASLPSAQDLDDEEHCGVAHCCHGSALVQSSSDTIYSAPGTLLHALDSVLNSRLPPPEIERPKWALATHAVASF